MTNPAPESVAFTPQGPMLIVGAHPDDTEFAAGGTIAIFTEAGQSVHYAVLTDGSKGTKDLSLDPRELVARREEEQRAAGRILGVTDVTFLHQTDGELENTPALRLALARLICQIKPHVLVGHDPWRPYMLHPDHRAAGFATTDAMVAARDHLYTPELYRDEDLAAYPVPEIWLFGADPCDWWIDTSSTIDRKIEAIMCHKTQLRDPEATSKRIREFGQTTGAQHGYGYAEGFKRLTPR